MVIDNRRLHTYGLTQRVVSYEIANNYYSIGKPEQVACASLNFYSQSKGFNTKLHIDFFAVKAVKPVSVGT